MRAQIISPAKWRLSQKMAIDAGRGRPGRPSFGPIWPCHVKCTLRGSTRAREDLPVRRQPGSSTSSFSFATSTPVVRGDRCAPRRLELSMSPVSPCTTGSQKTVIRLLMVEETFETNFFLSSRRPGSHHVYEYGNSRRDRPLFVSLPLWN